MQTVPDRTVMNFAVILEDTKHVIKAVWRAWNPI